MNDRPCGLNFCNFDEGARQDIVFKILPDCKDTQAAKLARARLEAKGLTEEIVTGCLATCTELSRDISGRVQSAYVIEEEVPETLLVEEVERSLGKEGMGKLLRMFDIV